MNIQIRENIKNTKDLATKQIDVRTVDVGNLNVVSDDWTFKTVSKPTGAKDLFHSKTGEEGLWLKYGDDNSPEIFVSLPEGSYGTYKIKILCRVFISNDEEVDVEKMDANGELIVSKEIQKIITELDLESKELELLYSEEYEWN